MIIVWLFLAILVIAFLGVIVVGSPYVPSRSRDLKQALGRLYPLSESDMLVDLGAGDGIVLRTAAAFGARAYGIELNPFLVLIAKVLNRNNPLVTIRFGNLRSMKLPPDVTVVYTFPNTKDIASLTRKLLTESSRLNRNFHLISYGSTFPDLALEKKEGAHLLYKVTSQKNTLTV
jgi:hypothetical protein